MKRATVLLVVAIAGCGGSSDPPKPDSPQHAVEAFIADVNTGDWKAACGITDAKARSVLALELGVSSGKEFDAFVRLKECPGALAAHADEVRARVSLAVPTSVRTEPGGAEVNSLRGNWGVAGPRAPSNHWLIDDFPPLP